MNTLLFIIFLLSPYRTYAQELDELALAANDPTAKLVSVEINERYIGTFRNIPDEKSLSTTLRTITPFHYRNSTHLLRATLPIITSAPEDNTGLADLVLTDLWVIQESWGRWVIGPSFSIPTTQSIEVDTQKWGIGPAVGASFENESLLYGILNQNFISFAGPRDNENFVKSVVQPVLSHHFKKEWTLGTSEMNLIYDWKNSRFERLPLGTKLSKLIRLGKVPTQLSAYYEYDFAVTPEAPLWSVGLVANFLFNL